MIIVGFFLDILTPKCAAALAVAVMMMTVKYGECGSYSLYTKHSSSGTHNEAKNRGYHIMQCGQRLRFLHE